MKDNTNSAEKVVNGACNSTVHTSYIDYNYIDYISLLLRRKYLLAYAVAKQQQAGQCLDGYDDFMG